MEYSQLNIDLMATKINIKLIHKNADLILENCRKLLFYYNHMFSFYDPNSQLSQINKAAGLFELQLSKELYYLINIGKYYSLQKNSSLNICMGPLVDLWNIGKEGTKVPKQADIAYLLPLCNAEYIQLDPINQSCFLKYKNMSIDLGSLAKGFIADKLRQYLQSQKVRSALINLGGNIITIGKNYNRTDGNWIIGLQDPAQKRGSHSMLLKINDLAITTSGIYERYMILENKKYHHILSPKTGYPIETDMASLTIISKNATDGEVWSSYLYGLNFKEISSICENNNIMAIAQYINGEIHFTNGVEKYVSRRK